MHEDDLEQFGRLNSKIGEPNPAAPALDLGSDSRNEYQNQQDEHSQHQPRRKPLPLPVVEGACQHQPCDADEEVEQVLLEKVAALVVTQVGINRTRAVHHDRSPADQEERDSDQGQVVVQFHGMLTSG